MPPLIDTWIAAETSIRGRNAADALADLNAALGTRYTHSHLSRWRAGKQYPSARTRQYMLRVSITEALQRCGISVLSLTDEQLDALADALT